MAKNLVEVEKLQRSVIFLEKEEETYPIRRCPECGCYTYGNSCECPECNHTSEPISPAELVESANKLKVELKNLKANNNEMATAGTLITMAGGISLAFMLGMNIAFFGLVALIGSLGLIVWFTSKRS